jgi:hypothetical protein
MKKNLFPAVCLLLATVVLATGCKKEDPEPTPALTVTDTPTTAVSAEGTSVKLNVQSNIAWAISEAPAWLTVTPTSGTGNAEVTITVAANEEAARFATLIISGATLKHDATIQQAAPQVVIKPVENLGDGSTDGSFLITANRTLTADKIWNLRGWVFVPEGVTLTIEPGTVIQGRAKASLIIMRGGKIMAEGREDAPIVFTSDQAPGNRRPSDWGGLIVLGKARINAAAGQAVVEGGFDALPTGKGSGLYGGDDDADNSGVLKYVRIEFAGFEFQPDKEINGLTMGGVGSGTTIEYVQVSHSGDDAFEWFGGKVNARHLIAYSSWDDDFDTDFGFTGNVQYGLIVRNPLVADKSGSNGFESDNDSPGDNNTPNTAPVFSNITNFGPVADPANYTDQGRQGGSAAGFFQAGVQLRRNTSTSLFNSVVVGWPIGLIIENDRNLEPNAQTNAREGRLVVNNVYLAGMQHNFQDKATNSFPVYSEGNGSAIVGGYFKTAGRGNVETVTAGLKLTGKANDRLNTPVIPAADSPLATAAAWTHAKVATGFDRVTYIGAFGPAETATNNWTNGWTNFDPQNTVY